MDQYLSDIFAHIGRKPIYGLYPDKPANCVSLYKALNDGVIPKSEEFITIYAMKSPTPQGYEYVSLDDCRQMTDSEIAEWKAFSDQRKADMNAARGKNNSNKELGSHHNKNNIPYYPDFDALAGKNIICFDTETTGIGKEDEILQLTITTFDGNKIKPIYSEYFKPTKHTSWEGAMAVNHITPEMVSSKKTIKESLSEFKDIFDNADIVTGYNVTFDVRMLKQDLGDLIDIPDEKITDAMVYFKKNEPDTPHKLIDAVHFYCPKLDDWFKENAHDAKSDAIATLSVLKAMGEKEGVDITERNKEEDIDL